MIASRRGVAVLIAIAVALAIVVGVDALRVPAVTSRELAPDFVAGRVTALAWARPGQPDVRVTHAATGHWTFAAPAQPGWADARVIADLLAAVRGARWHRRAERARAGTVHATLTITSDALPTRVLGLGEPLAGSEQTWLVDGADAVLVDSWVARALEPDPFALRVRTPLADVLAARTIAVHDASLDLDLVLAGTPRRIVTPYALWPAPDRVHSLESALAALTLVRLPDRAITGASGLHVTLGGVDGGELTEAGGCRGAPTLVAVVGPWGDGCVDAAAWRTVLDAALAFTVAPDQLVDSRPAPIAIAYATLADGAQLDLTGRPRLALTPTTIVDADPPRVAAWLATLAVFGETVARPTTAPTSTITVSDRAGTTIVLDVYAAAGVLARHGEPVALRLGAADFATLVAPGRALRDPRLWLEEPTSITTVTIDAITWRRGAVIGEWTRTPPASYAPATLEHVVASLAAPSGDIVDAPGFITAHHLAFDAAEPGAPPTHRELDIGQPAHDGCLIRVANFVHLTQPLLCLAVDELARPTHD